ncbi:alpha/beta hydrolase [Flaviaesturariibacter flavus]|uniref:Alpha/beta hydrolase n=1 Tax=Flaviaesturariibacter flavus TaxID=2502780 RepID=A0A4R1BML6_9BACT|nr:alpha/beta hydrolase [Flaviaesturariibacter flavus]TCJ18669.1 alpha/beta hydrolase [Flaviaesturariibacter flavus]
MRYLFALVLAFVLSDACAQAPSYPYPVGYIRLDIERKAVRMAYMDVQPRKSNGEAVLLLHGKNFNGYYWKGVIEDLAQQGYRVIVPDQVGWGLSDKPDIHYSFHLLARNTKALLDTLGIQKINVVGHSMGGMLAARFVLMYRDRVSRLVLENPIGLEDYRAMVPYRTPDEQFAQELKATRASLKEYQQSYYPQWKPEYEQYVDAQWMALQYPDFRSATWASALTYNMIYEQPVVHELHLLVKTLLVIGQEDRTVVGKALIKGDKTRYGNYPALGRWLQRTIKGAQLVELKGVGHIPHIQAPEAFRKAMLSFLKS